MYKSKGRRVDALGPWWSYPVPVGRVSYCSRWRSPSRATSQSCPPQRAPNKQSTACRARVASPWGSRFGRGLALNGAGQTAHLPPKPGEKKDVLFSICACHPCAGAIASLYRSNFSVLHRSVYKQFRRNSLLGRRRRRHASHNTQPYTHTCTPTQYICICTRPRRSHTLLYPNHPPNNALRLSAAAAAAGFLLLLLPRPSLDLALGGGLGGVGPRTELVHARLGDSIVGVGDVVLV